MDQENHLETSSQVPRSSATNAKGNGNRKKTWVSLDQYNSDPEFAEKAGPEFLTTPLREDQEGKKEDDGFSRRDFMKIMTASTALATSACFQRPQHKILPYVNQPEEVTFGVPNYYASTCTECSSSCGTLVKTREGRPIKIEGNPEHPMNRGGLCARGQASILNLYDPDRLRNPVTMIRGTATSSTSTWAEVDKKIADKLKSSAGRVRILSGTVTSPTTQKLIDEFLKVYAHGSHVVYDAIGDDTAAKAQELSYGTRLVPRYRVDKADTIVSIEGDFLGTWLSPVEFTKQFTKNRRLTDSRRKMSKLITFESAMTLTGTNADVRVAIQPQDAALVALAIANELVNAKHASTDGETAAALKNYSATTVAQHAGIDPKQIQKTAAELWEARGRSLVLTGSAQSQSENALALHLAVNLLNSLLGNDGITVDYAQPSRQLGGSHASLVTLIKEMNNGEIDALLIVRTNPGYNLPKSLGFNEATKKVGLVVSFNDRVDETATLADYVCPDNHGLESWGDAEPQKGLYSLVQPTIRPIYDTRSFEDSLLAFVRAGAASPGAAALGKFKDFHEYLQNNWRESVYKESGSSAAFNLFWESALRDGAVNTHKESASTPRGFRSAALKQNLPKMAGVNGAYSLVFHEQVAASDGRNANNAWLQELPDPISRICWDNYVSVSTQAAEKLHLEDNDVLRVSVGDNSFELPVHVQPGLHEKVLAIALGYGREAAGSVGSNVGQNMFRHATVQNGALVFAGLGASVIKTGAKANLASVQESHTMDGRDVVKFASLEEFIKNPKAGNEEDEKLTTIWSGFEYKGYRWHMAIDLNSCTGCAACVVGCQSENNIPVVGKDGVIRSRIMHWLRIDRYYSGTPDNPQVFHQPMLCQHCENAPCETVCPVIATAHDDEGLNMQIYNRCVGTRYCANNCPYKVRRFNWFDYNYGGQIRYPQTLSQNPEVTVRSRGVMEKCTFCIQRIHDGKNAAKDQNRLVADGEIKTACQSSCPGDAITFGNINDTESRVADLAKSERGYRVLNELNTRPSITYLTKIKNVEQV